jgi:ABC-type amino acid transport substrate-binding protein
MISIMGVFLAPALALAAEYKLARSSSLTAMFPEVEAAVQSAFESLGHSVIIEVFPEARGTAFVKSGVLDGELIRAVAFGGFTSGIVQVPVTLATTEMKLFYLNDDSIKSLSDMEGKSIGGLRGAPVFKKFASDYGANLFELNDFRQGILMLRSKRIAGIFMPKALAQIMIPADMDTGEVDEPLATLEFVMWLSDRHSDLVPELTDALK